MSILGSEAVVIGGSSTPSVSVTVPSGTIIAELFWCGYDTAAALDISSATLNSVALSQKNTCANATANWTSAGSVTWANPSAGSVTLAPVWNATPDSMTAFMVYRDGVGTTAHDQDSAGDFGTFPTGATLTLDANSGEDCVAIDGSYGGVPANESGYTSLQTQTGSGGIFGRLRTIAASGSTVTATTQDPANFAQVAASTFSAAAGAPVRGLLRGKLIRGGMLSQGLR